jgi:hypothetical protein
MDTCSLLKNTLSDLPKLGCPIRMHCLGFQHTTCCLHHLLHHFLSLHSKTVGFNVIAPILHISSMCLFIIV